MKILFVEDTDDAAALVMDRVPDVTWVRVKSRDPALQELGNPYDLIIIDLSIPPDEESNDHKPEHGMAVLGSARAECPGTPVIIFSAYGESVMDELTDFISQQGSEDYLGDGGRPMVWHRSKGRVVDITDQIKEHAAVLVDLRTSIDLNWTGERINLDPLDDRVLRIHARRHDARVINIRPLTAGRSGALTLLIKLSDSSGNARGNFVAKLNSSAQVADELERYGKWIRPYLPGDAYSNSVETVTAGASDRGAVFYAVASGESRALINLLPEHQKTAATVVSAMGTSFARWDEAATAADREVGEILRDVVSESRLNNGQFYPPESWDTPAVEGVSAACCIGPVHGDLHAGNILVGSQNNGVLIDYGSAGRGSRVFDPVALELSALLHADAPDLGLWPTITQAENWLDRASFLVDCPIPDYVSACRDWLEKTKRADREAAAAVYSYARWQLTFPSIKVGRREEIAAALAGGAARWIRESVG